MELLHFVRLEGVLNDTRHIIHDVEMLERGRKNMYKENRHRFTDRQKADTRKIQLHQQIQLEGFYDQKDKTIDENRVIFK